MKEKKEKFLAIKKTIFKVAHKVNYDVWVELKKIVEQCDEALKKEEERC